MAYNRVLDHPFKPKVAEVYLEKALGRVLAETLKADRNFPPFNRATMDGIAINSAALKTGTTAFDVIGVLPAGAPGIPLGTQDSCIEIMTGAVVPDSADQIIPYEVIEIKDGKAYLKDAAYKRKNIHQMGSDAIKGQDLLFPGKSLRAADIGLLAAVGKTKVKVNSLPTVLLVSTGDELVDVGETPKAHQIRKSNVYSLKAALSLMGIEADMLHLKDKPEQMRIALEKALDDYDVLMLSGGVSRGKFDYLPQVLNALQVTKHFHRVAQRPGKPFWFGSDFKRQCTIFSFPGNPVSTFVNFQVYFKAWMTKSYGESVNTFEIALAHDVSFNSDLTHLVLVREEQIAGKLQATPISGNGSGDLVSLTEASGCVKIEGGANYRAGELVSYFHF